MPFLFLSQAFDLVHKAGRIAKTDILCNMMRVVIHTTPCDLVHVVNVLTSKFYPESPKVVKLGIGNSMLYKALAETCGKSVKEIEDEHTKEKDLGLVAKKNRASQPVVCKTDPLTVEGVLETIRLIGKVIYVLLSPFLNIRSLSLI